MSRHPLSFDEMNLPVLDVLTGITASCVVSLALTERLMKLSIFMFSLQSVHDFCPLKTVLLTDTLLNIYFVQ